ncbi:tetratricopeptide repeat protein [Chryseobacterium sp. ISL-6]|uniref:tetratricopeptide repeat protein n=1 Tax=Chryseobacterium sp. ISL-6 TaxID=2819143 RepID=UPI001BE8D9FF|nr:tetratricopeptide repeat protein [Chryseobacterium sp. ISL-6]MBT2623758.1 AraC family transcriptional regulator [Chryseobacterium sp. ISL-6]
MTASTFLLLIFSFFTVNVFHAENRNEDYIEIRSRYENFEKEDSAAFKYINKYIQKAKSESDFVHLVQGYKDAVYYTSSHYNKLAYADSTIFAALRSQKDELISDSYLGKGIFYYFTLKKYEPALSEYLKAYEYSAGIKDEYLQNKIIYHLAVVKSYLGYHDEALELFQKCLLFFELKTKQKDHPNNLFNYNKGYYNSLHQLVICYRNLKKYNTAEKLTNLGLKKLGGVDDFPLEKSYLLKCRGILQYHRQNYEGSVNDLTRALPEIRKSKDFSWESVIYYYLGKNYMLADKEKGLRYLKKVDSIFNKQNFILPELRTTYEDLINYYSEKGNIKEQLYYTNQLIRVDNLIGENFTYLTSKIHREYDTKSLLENKGNLERMSFRRMIYSIALVVLMLLFFILFIFHYLKEKKIKNRYQELQEKLSSSQNSNLFKPSSSPRVGVLKTTLTDDIYNHIAAKLITFEDENNFTKKGLTLSSLASKINTNTSYLSIFINENKEKNFKTYINGLRISYITKLLNTDRKFLHYTIEALAEEAGVSTRQHFSDLFYEANGLRPKDFIRKKKEELDMNQ